jgi:hypothetical protein
MRSEELRDSFKFLVKSWVERQHSADSGQQSAISRFIKENIPPVDIHFL